MEVAAFHPHPFDRMRLVSVALFLAFAAARAYGLSRLGVTQHPALRSPDFPPPALALARCPGGNGLADFERLFYHRVPSASRQCTTSPARRGTTVFSPKTYSGGTVQVSRRSVTVSPLRGRP